MKMSNGNSANGGGTGGQLMPGHQEFTLTVICSAMVNQDQLWRLFDIIPGLDYCQIIGESGPNSNRAIVKYNNPESCAYAKEKLHGLEYPLGERLIVKMEVQTGQAVVAVANATPVSINAGVVAAAGNVRQLPVAAGSVSGGAADLPLQAQMDGWDNNNLCSVTLPPPAQLAFAGSVCAQRCFLVCVSQVNNQLKNAIVILFS